VSELRAAILCAATWNQTGHIPSALSILELVQGVYNVMEPTDRFVLSKGHGSLALYAVAAERGIITWEEFHAFGMPGGKLGDHPDRHNAPWIEASTGSLGHGLPIACGMAYGIDKGRVFCLIGDGECLEGSVWEAAQVAAALRLSNLTAIVDLNRSNEAGDLGAKFTAFGWKVRHIDGHDLCAIEKALHTEGGPLCILAHTVKGFGCAEMEADPGAWHHRQPRTGELKDFVQRLTA
jgi:transketolase